MKYILVIGDGMADNALEALDGRTPLQCAKKPCIDAMAREGLLGSVRTVPEGFPPGSDTAIMTIFGCANEKYYSGRAPLEAAAQGLMLQPGDAAFRCNNVTLSDGENFEDKHILSHSGSGIEGAEGRELAEWLFSHPDFAPLAEQAGMSIHPTESYRHIAVKKAADIRGIRLAPPHDHLGETVGANLPAGCADAKTLIELMQKANELLDRHPLNLERRAQGKQPANGVWFWAEGTAAALPDFAERYGHAGTVISAVPLCHGIAALCGLEIALVPCATGELDTNFAGKVEATLAALEKHNFAAVHLEAPDECTHCHDLPGKLEAIERLDHDIVAPIVSALREKGEDFRVLILSDHKTLMKDGSHDGTPVPFLIYDSRENAGSGLDYTEENGEKGPFIPDGTALMNMLFEV